MASGVTLPPLLSILGWQWYLALYNTRKSNFHTQYVVKQLGWIELIKTHIDSQGCIQDLFLGGGGGGPYLGMSSFATCTKNCHHRIDLPEFNQRDRGYCAGNV